MSDNRDDKRTEREAGRAIALLRQPGGGLRVELKSVGDIGDMARVMASTGIGVRAAFRGNIGACFRVCWQAAAWNMDPFAVASKAYVVKNQRGEEEVSYEAQLIHAAISGSGVMEGPFEEPEYHGHGNEMYCVVTGTLRGGDVRTYQSPQIKNIRVKNSPLWQSDPELQLWYFSVRNWARKWANDVLLGVYTPDEFEYGGVIDGEATEIPERPQPAQFRASTHARQEAWQGDGIEAQQTPTEPEPAPEPPAPPVEEPGSEPEVENEEEEEDEDEPETTAEPAEPEARFTIAHPDGNLISCNDEMMAFSEVVAAISEAAQRGKATLEGCWADNEGQLGTFSSAQATALRSTYAGMLLRAEQKAPPPLSMADVAEAQDRAKERPPARRGRRAAAPPPAEEGVDDDVPPFPLDDDQPPQSLPHSSEDGELFPAAAPPDNRRPANRGPDRRQQEALSQAPGSPESGAPSADGASSGLPMSERLVWTGDNTRQFYSGADIVLKRMTERKARPHEYVDFRRTYADALRAVEDEMGRFAGPLLAKLEAGEKGA